MHRGSREGFRQHRRTDRRARAGSFKACGGCDRFGPDRCFISALRRQHRASCSGSSTPSRRRASPAATPGASCPTTSAKAATRGSPAATIRISNLTYWGIAQAKPWMHASRGTTAKRRRAVHQLPRSRSARTTGRWRGTSSTRPASRSISTKCSSACSSTSAIRRSLHHRQGRHPLEARSPNRRVPRSPARPSSRTSSTRSMPTTGAPTYRAGHHRAAASSSGFSRARAPKAATTGRR